MYLFSDKCYTEIIRDSAEHLTCAQLQQFGLVGIDEQTVYTEPGNNFLQIFDQSKKKLKEVYVIPNLLLFIGNSDIVKFNQCLTDQKISLLE